MKGRLAVALALTLLLTAGCAKPVTIDESKLVDITWVNWDTGTQGMGTIDRAALLVPVKINGKEVLLQLDTGANSTRLDSSALDRAGIEYTAVLAKADPSLKQTQLTIALGSFRRRTMTVFVAEPEPSEKVPGTYTDQSGRPLPEGIKAGTLGADFFRGAALYIDFQESKLAAFAKAPRVSGQTAAFGTNSGRPVITLEGERNFNALYDTGASAFEITVGTGVFKEMTGVDPRDESTRKLIGPRFGENVEIFSRPTDLTYRAGEIALHFDTLWTLPVLDELEANTSHQVNAIIGNEVFRSDRILLDFAAKRLTVLSEP